MGYVMVILICLFIATIDRDYSQPWEHEAAKVVCEKNGGYKEFGYRVWGDGSQYLVICEDEAEFTLGDLEFKNKVESK